MVAWFFILSSGRSHRHQPIHPCLEQSILFHGRVEIWLGHCVTRKCSGTRINKVVERRLVISVQLNIISQLCSSYTFKVTIASKMENGILQRLCPRVAALSGHVQRSRLSAMNSNLVGLLWNGYYSINLVTSEIIMTTMHRCV